MPIGVGTGLAVAGGASLIGSGIQAYGASKAADVQAQAAANALQLQQSEFQTGQNNLAPFIGAGTNALGTISGLMGSNGQAPNYSAFTNSPDYQFAQQQGNLGVQRYLSATGLSQSGGAMKDISTFNQGLASQQYGNYFGRLMGLATLGNNAAGASAGLAGNAASTMGNTIQGIGQAQASGIVGTSNAISGGLGGIGNNFMLAGLLGNMGTASKSAYSAPGSALSGGGLNFAGGGLS